MLLGGGMDDKALLTSIEKIYSASLAPERWDDALNHLRETTNCQFMSLLTQGIDGTNTQFIGFLGKTKKFAEAYINYYSSISDMLPYAMAKNPGEIYLDEMYPDYKGYLNSEIYHDFWAPYRFEHLLSLILEKKNGNCRYLGVRRSASAGAFGQKELTLFQTLYPHIKQALRVNSQIENTEILKSSLMEGLDRVKSGILILNQDQKAIFVNKAANTILEQRDGLVLNQQGRLRAKRVDDNGKLSVLIGQSGASFRDFDLGALDVEHHPGGSVGISRPSGKRSFGILVVPMGRRNIDQTDLSTLSQPTTMVFIKDPEVDVGMTGDLLADILHLTPSEGRITALLCDGLSPKEIAKNMTLTEGTVRFYLKSIFQKTDTNRQADLVRLAFLSVPESNF